MKDEIIIETGRITRREQSDVMTVSGGSPVSEESRRIVEIDMDGQTSPQEDQQKPPFDPDPPNAPLSPEDQDVAPDTDPFILPEDRVANQVKHYMALVLSGGILYRMKQFAWIMVAVGVLMLFYISIVFNMQQLNRRETRLSRQVKELKVKQMDYALSKMEATRASAIIEQLKQREIPLTDSFIPPVTIE